MRRATPHHNRPPRGPYWRLTVQENAPVYPFRTVVTGVTAFEPGLFFPIIDPLLRYWGEPLSSEEEFAVLESRGCHSGSA